MNATARIAVALGALSIRLSHRNVAIARTDARRVPDRTTNAPAKRPHVARRLTEGRTLSDTSPNRSPTTR